MRNGENVRESNIITKLFLTSILGLLLLTPSIASAEVNIQISAGEAINRANAQVNAPSWALRYCSNSFSHEHVTAYKCSICLNAAFAKTIKSDGHRLKIKNIRKTIRVGKKRKRVIVRKYIGGYVGRLQMGHSWNINHSAVCNDSHVCSTCQHTLSDWRNCPECSAYRFLVGAKSRGRSWVIGQWGQTCRR